MQRHRIPKKYRKKVVRDPIPDGWERVFLGEREKLKVGDFLALKGRAQRIEAVDGLYAFVAGCWRNVGMVKYKIFPKDSW